MAPEMDTWQRSGVDANQVCCLSVCFKGIKKAWTRSSISRRHPTVTKLSVEEVRRSGKESSKELSPHLGGENLLGNQGTCLACLQ